ncbi:MAG: TetR/AcrR family transcriptional regulator [Deltaproteobacteria bacterium]|nr:TetR/AcrR family transcriptional regulator [Deltaproteobacteria bacterium]
MGVRERKAREREQRANGILEAARHMFETKGFLNTTLADVAKEAEISVGLIYRYFQSKEDIFASLALKGAEQFDKDIDSILKKAQSGKKKPTAAFVLYEIATTFFKFYKPYGEYFDMLIYSYKGLKHVQIHGATLTRLMSVTLSSLDKLKNYILISPHFSAKEEDEALRVVFVLWGILLGSHLLFDSSGRGHLFAFRQDEFVQRMIDQILVGITAVPLEPPPKTSSRSGTRTTELTQ